MATGLDRLQRMKTTVTILAISITALNLYAGDQKNCKIQTKPVAQAKAGQTVKSRAKVKKEDTYQPYDYGFWWTEGPILKKKKSKISSLLLSKK